MDNANPGSWASLSLYEQLCADASGSVWNACAEQWRQERAKLQAKMRTADLSDAAQFSALQKIDEALGAAEYLLNAVCRRDA